MVYGVWCSCSGWSTGFGWDGRYCCCCCCHCCWSCKAYRSSIVIGYSDHHVRRWMLWGNWLFLQKSQGMNARNQILLWIRAVDDDDDYGNDGYGDDDDDDIQTHQEWENWKHKFIGLFIIYGYCARSANGYGNFEMDFSFVKEKEESWRVAFCIWNCSVAKFYELLKSQWI